MNQHILIVEDEKNLGITLKEYLEGRGNTCQLAVNAAQAQALFERGHPEVVLMDIGLPDGCGLELATRWRKARQDFVLLFLSAQNDPETKVSGLEIGAQDYITKPFALKELVLRLERIGSFNRELEQFKEQIEHGPLSIWFKRYQVKDAEGNLIDLSQKENAILELLYSKRAQAVAREEIIEKVWGTDKYPSNRTVDNYIVKLRRWCETDPDAHIEIQSIRGIGYKLLTKD